jgi:hypothetical protein
MVRRRNRSQIASRRSGVSPLHAAVARLEGVSRSGETPLLLGLPRRGIVLTELIVAAALLGTLLVVCLQLVAATSVQGRVAEQRRLAAIELGNVMEHLAARPWAELTPQMAAPSLSPSVRNRLPGAELKVEVTTPSGEPEARRIVVLLRWQDRAGQLISPMAITTWRWKR